MINIYHEAKKMKSNPSYFWQMVCEKGGYETAKQVLSNEQRLWGEHYLKGLKETDGKSNARYWLKKAEEQGSENAKSWLFLFETGCRKYYSY